MHGISSSHWVQHLVQGALENGMCLFNVCTLLRGQIVQSSCKKIVPEMFGGAGVGEEAAPAQRRAEARVVDGDDGAQPAGRVPREVHLAVVVARHQAEDVQGRAAPLRDPPVIRRAL